MTNNIFGFAFPGEDHTLGNLLQTSIYENSRSEIDYVSYHIPHPLKVEFVLKLKFKDDAMNLKDAREFLKKSIEKIKKYMEKMREDFRKEDHVFFKVSIKSPDTS